MDKLAFVLGYTEGLDQLAKIAGAATGTPNQGSVKKNISARDAAMVAEAERENVPGIKGALGRGAHAVKEGVSEVAGKVGDVAGKAVPSKEALTTIAKYLGSAGVGGAAGAGVGYLAGDTGIGAGAGAGVGAALPAAKSMAQAPGANWKAKALAALLTAGAGTAGAGAGYGVEQAVA